MIAATTLLLLLLLVVLLLLLRRRWRRQRLLPPGPWGLPIVGYLPWMDKRNAHKSLASLATRFGDVFRVQLGGRTAVCIASRQLLQEVFSDPASAGRLQTRLSQELTGGCGILFAEGESWRRQRNFSIRFLGKFTASCADMLQRELEDLLEVLDAAADSGEAVDTLQPLSVVANSVISQLTFGRRFGKYDADYCKYLQAFHEYAELMSPVPALFPAVDAVFGWTRVAEEIRKRHASMREFALAQVSHRRQLLAADAEEAKCLADAYLLARRRAEADASEEAASQFSSQQLVRVCMELFFGGTETTARTLQWLLLLCALHPQYQKEAQQQLDAACCGRAVATSDKQRLPLLLAIIDEANRFASISSNGVMHRAVRDMRVGQYRVPAGTALLPLVYSVHRDPRLWARPHDFWPGHFLGDTGDYRPSPNLIPFMLGRRACPGEALAKQQVFLIFTSLLQRYSISLAEAAEPSDLLEGRLALIRIPGQHTLRFARRDRD